LSGNYGGGGAGFTQGSKIILSEEVFKSKTILLYCPEAKVGCKVAECDGSLLDKMTHKLFQKFRDERVIVSLVQNVLGHILKLRLWR